MKYQNLITFLTIILLSSCEFQTFSGPEMNEKKMEQVSHYFSLLEAEEIEMYPFDQEWEDSDLPILVKNSKLVQITEEFKLTNSAVVDTLASSLWNAVENKEKYKRIRIGFSQSSSNGLVEKTKVHWLDYPTNILK